MALFLSTNLKASELPILKREGKSIGAERERRGRSGGAIDRTPSSWLREVAKLTGVE